MRPGMGKAKGAEFERKVCKDLSLWISKGERDDIFWRSAMSGGRATVNIKKGGENVTQLGDISMVDASGTWLIDKFVVECKFYKSLSLSSLIYGTPKDSSIMGFWMELAKISNTSKKLPMLVGKENGRKPLVAVANIFVSELQKRGIEIPNFTLYTNYSLCLFDFEDFLKIPAETVKGIFDE